MARIFHEYASAIDRARDAVLATVGSARAPSSGATPAELEAAFAAVEVLPEEGAPLDEVIGWIEREVLAHSIVLTDPACAAHLHQPPSVAGLAADVMVSASNQSLDAWDAGPAAMLLETRLLRWLGDQIGMGDGTFTPGATQSNLMGLLLARDKHCRDRGHDVRRDGLPPWPLRIACSPDAHFSVAQAAAILGVGEANVGDVEDPFAVVVTAGTTDLGIIEPVPETDAWVHVDAAYAGGLLLSPKHRPLLPGIERADSIAVDFHKLSFCPIPCGAFLLRDPADFALMARHADYLNPASDLALGIPDLVSKSLQTTRAFDALKLWTVLQHLGRRGLEEAYDALLALAAATAAAVRARPELELLREPPLTTVVFRHRSADNDAIRRALQAEGRAVIARTRIDGEVWLKLTLLNPSVTDMEPVLDAVVEKGGREIGVS